MKRNELEMMENVSKETRYGIEIYDYDGVSYRSAVSFGTWRVAYLNHGKAFVEENFEKVERHNDSDEVFILLQGKATLIIGEELNRIEMEPHKIYNVPEGVWHHIFTTEGTSVIVVENEDTDNTDFLYIKEQ
ncbi:MAG: cupin domain-containing protein [Clostridia bacterium]|nr:cupin domain-containing protein [Clostridia bacterium]MEE0410329.1 cupin domain-containing protein [Clostridia bacterium]